MVSSNKAGFNLREIIPLSQILRKALERLMGQRPDPNACSHQKGHRNWSSENTSSKIGAGYLNYPASGRDSAKSGLGYIDNRHLSYLAESIFVNVGDSHRNAKVSSPPMFDVRVGATIVVRDGEKPSHAEHRCRCFAGEGSQSVGTSRANVTDCQHGGISYEYW